jgi:hypothetical protein
MRREDKLGGLAAALGVSQAKLQAALEKVRPERGERHVDLANVLAAKLGVSADKVRAAFDKLHDRGAGKDDLAKAIGVSPAKLEQAFRSLRPGFRKDGPEGRDDHVAALAKALGLSTAKVQAAFEKFRQSHEAEHQKIEDDFAAKLAAKLKLDEAKVKSALEEFGPHRHP